MSKLVAIDIIPSSMKKVVSLYFLILASFLEVSVPAQTDENQDLGSGNRWAPVIISQPGKTGFKLLTPEQSGITFTNTLDEKSSAANRVLSNGSGVAVGDYDHDGFPDIYFCSLNGRNTLYRNLGGFKFRDVTRESGIVCSNQYCRGAVFADVNGDTHLDLLVATTGQGVFCFLNDGRGKFSDVSATSGTVSNTASVTMALADVDGNGTLDLYVCNNRADDIRDRGQLDVQMANGVLVAPPAFKNRLFFEKEILREYGEPDSLYLNDGLGHFTAVSWTNGTFLDEDGKVLSNPPLDWGLTATFRDFNNDGAPDLYVCNDYWTPDRIWVNDGHGRFQAIGKLAFRNTSASSMGVDFADLNRSGNMDLLVVDMLSRDPQWRKRQMLAQKPVANGIGEIANRPQFMRNTLFRNRGDGSFEELANFAGLAASEWAWQPLFLDVDLDGLEDVLITTGHAKDVQDLDADDKIKSRQTSGKLERAKAGGNPKAILEAFVEDKLQNGRLYPRLETPIVAFHNKGNYSFEEMTSIWGTDTPGVHHGAALADFDQDGDLDLVVNNLGSAIGIYRNETTAPRIAVRLKGKSGNSHGIGAKIKLLDGAVPMQSQEMVSGGRYMAGSDSMLTFAAGVSTNMIIEVEWRNGTLSRLKQVRPNRLYEISEENARPKTAPPAPVPSEPWFKDVSHLLKHWQTEEPFDDFERQPLLPKKLSQLGPGVAWVDLDGDQHDELVIGSGKGGKLAAFRNDGKGGFIRLTQAPFDRPVTQDQTAILGWPNTNGGSSLLVGSANYENGLTNGSSVRLYDIFHKSVVDLIPGQTSSTGPLALADLDGDGNLDLFVGGRVLPGRYPAPASSKIYRNDGQQWKLDLENSRLLEKKGMVSGAVWSDLDGDGFPELILACEWGPIVIFKNDSGKLKEATAELGMDQFTGWWNGVTTGDLDGDGKPDIIASNWGLNTPYSASPERPLTLYYGEFSGRGTMDIIETEYDSQLKDLAPRRFRKDLASALPFLPDRFPTHVKFSQASVKEIFGSTLQQASAAKVNSLTSMVFLNRGSRFEPMIMPREAQLAPAFGVSVADFDGDGLEDLFLSQNFFDYQPEIPRSDSGLGLVLKGDGTGKLFALENVKSGVRIFGEQKGSAVGDFNEDGRLDIAVTQNAATTKLFQNHGAKPGLRVRLAGPGGNPTAIGALVRAQTGGISGLAREIHSGSGYWGADSPVVVLTSASPIEKVWVRWPGGKTTIVEVPANSREISVDWKKGLVGSEAK